jgi:excisionase family DNA binding protein
MARRDNITPSLDAIAADPAAAVSLSVAAKDILVRRCAVVLAALSAGGGDEETNHAEAPDRLLDVKEAAERLGCHPDTLYRRASEMPFAVRLGPGQLRFSSNGLDSYIRQRSNRIKSKS